MEEDGDVRKPFGASFAVLLLLIALVAVGSYYFAGSGDVEEPSGMSVESIHNPSSNVSDGVYFACMSTIGAVSLYEEGKCTSDALLATIESAEENIRGMGSARGDSLAVNCIRNIISYARGLPTYYDGGTSTMMIDKYCSDIVAVVNGTSE